MGDFHYAVPPPEPMSSASNRTAGLGAFFAPAAIAVVGATEDPARIGGQVLANVRWGFGGPILPISRSRPEVQGLPAVPRLTDLDRVPDLAIVAVSGEQVVEVVRDAAQLGVPGLVVLSAGFAEAGAEGARRQEELAELARAAGIRVLGPNTIGFLAPGAGVYASFLHNAAEETAVAPVALITQSGAIGAYLLRMLRSGGVGLELSCPTGNEADITTTDVLEHVIDETDIQLALVCIEGTRDVDRLIAVGRRARAAGKTILLLKIGVTEAGARAAESHSGAISSDAAAFSAALRHAGIVEVATVAALARYGPLFLAGRRPAGNRLGVLTTSGGLGIHLTDRAARVGIEVPPLPQADQRRIAAVLPSYASAANPVDVTGNVVNDFDSLREAAVGMMQSDGIDMGLVYATNVGAPREEAAFAAIIDAYQAGERPMLALAHDELTARKLIERGVCSVADVDLAVGALGALLTAGSGAPAPARQALGPDAAPVRRAREAAAADGSLAPDAAFALLEAFEIEPAAYTVAATLADAVQAAAEIGAPVALKLAVGEVAHKSDVGGVILGLEGEAAVAAAAERLLEIAAERSLPPRILVQAMSRSGIELFAGMYRAPGIGPLVVFGLGGVLVEILAETRTVLALDDDAALEDAVRGLCGGRLGGHGRGLSATAIAAFVQLLGRLATLAVSLPEVEQVDLNPVIVVGNEIAVVDAVCVIAAPSRTAGRDHAAPVSLAQPEAVGQ
jgi:acyl-CoA synthetase (NDP forming)